MIANSCHIGLSNTPAAIPQRMNVILRTIQHYFVNSFSSKNSNTGALEILSFLYSFSISGGTSNAANCQTIYAMGECL